MTPPDQIDSCQRIGGILRVSENRHLEILENSMCELVQRNERPVANDELDAAGIKLLVDG